MNKFQKGIVSSRYFTTLPFNFLLNMVHQDDVDIDKVSWEVEKNDILERANWLCEKVIVTPKQLLKNMPSSLGRFYGGQWAIYSCSMLAAALCNISKIYPDVTDKCIEQVEKIIQIVLSPEIREYDTMAWKEDALCSLDGAKSHMTYLSILAWIVSNYKLIGGSEKYDQIFHSCCETLNRRMLESKNLNLLSFPNKPIFIPDMLFTIVALKNYAKLYNGIYADSVDKWLEKAKTEWLHKRTQLLVSMIKWNSRPIRGSYTALSCYCLTLIDPFFAKDQYEKMKRFLRKDSPLCGIKEYLYKSPNFKFDVNAGPIAFGLSPSGTAFAIGSATFFQDWKFRNELLRTAEIAGNTIKGNKQRHYQLGELVIVGEAVTLAMRTNIA